MAATSPDHHHPQDRNPQTPTKYYTRTNSSKYNRQRSTVHQFFIYSPKLFFYFLTTCALVFILLQISHLQVSPITITSPSSPIWSHSLALVYQWHKSILNISSLSPDDATSTVGVSTAEAEAEAEANNMLGSLAEKLRESVTFLPLKDLRFAHRAPEGHTWFMSSMNDTQVEGEVQYLRFPSEASRGRVLCLKGRDASDGSQNYYALAWPKALPSNATFMKGLTFVSYNHYDYENIWHGLSNTFPFVAWHRKSSCRTSPERWILYHWGELRSGWSPWLSKIMEATFGRPPYIEVFDKVGEDCPVCFEEAVVMRHNEGGMSREKMIEAYELLRCKVRKYCNVSTEPSRNLGNNNTNSNMIPVRLTLLLRRGARSFKNESDVVGIFQRECDKAESCRLKVVHSNDLSFCDQVELLSSTDIVVSPHGAQLTNLFMMDRGSSVMELFPYGWLQYAGVGQYVFRWLSSWSGMNHEGAWWDPKGEDCPTPEDALHCFDMYKNAQIAHNTTHFGEWTRRILNEVKLRKLQETQKNSSSASASAATDCFCG